MAAGVYCKQNSLLKNVQWSVVNIDTLNFSKNCDLNLGLFYEDELIQAISITFKGWHDGNTELTRMTTKLNTQVVGGFSKLISYFCKNYKRTK